MQLIFNESLYLKKIELEDASIIFNLIDTNREHLRRWLPFVDYTLKIEDSEDFINQVSQKRADFNDLVCLIFYLNQPVGLIGLKGIDLTNRKTEIGYWLVKEAEGNGIMTNACKTLVKYAFNRLHLNKITIRHAIGNVRSGNIPVKLGFKLEGIEREGELINEVYHDLMVHSLLFSEFRNKNGKV